MVAELIEAVHQEPVIWDYKCREYKNRYRRFDGFQSVCDKLSHLSPELTPEICRVKWFNIKSYYQVILNNEMRNKSGDPYKRPPSWIHYRAMNFLNSTLSTTTTEEDFKPSSSVNKKPKSQEGSHPDTQDQGSLSGASFSVEESENQEEPEETVIDQNDSQIEDLQELPRLHDPIPRNDHSSKKRKKQDNSEDNYVEDAVVKYLEESISRRESNNQRTVNEQRGLIWGQELDCIQNVQLRGQCIIKITNIIQEALMEDERHRNSV